MGSKQLNFFITPDEYNRINEMILTKNIILILKQNISDKREVIISKTLPPVDINKIR